MASSSRHMSTTESTGGFRPRQQSSGSLPPPSPRANLLNLPVRSPQPLIPLFHTPPPAEATLPPLNNECEDWMNSVPFVASQLYHQDTCGRDAFVDISSDQSVEDACTLMVERDVSCLAVFEAGSENPKKYVGLFDYTDLNAFLLIAVNSHSAQPEDLPVRVREIIEKGKQGGDATVGLACDLSETNPLNILPKNSSIVSLLKVFSHGTHRVLLADEQRAVESMISDRQLVKWFTEHASEEPTLSACLAAPLSELPLLQTVCTPRPVISATSDETILDAMSLISKEGVSSVAVVEAPTGVLLSAVSATDIGKIVAPSQDKKILTTPLSQFVARIKDVDGSLDGEDRYPVFGVLPSSTLGYTIQKLLATNSHRVFITDDSTSPCPVFSASPVGNVIGVVSMGDVLSVFARLANIPDVDPRSMSRHRRASSATSSSSSGRLSKRSSLIGVPILSGSGLGLTGAPGTTSGLSSLSSSLLGGSALSSSQSSMAASAPLFAASPVRSLSIGHRRDRSGSLSGASLRSSADKK